MMHHKLFHILLACIVNSPRFPDSIFILCDAKNDLLPVGTAFAISTKHLLTAYHCLDTTHNSYTITKILEWNCGLLECVEGTLNVEVISFCAIMDWAILKLSGETSSKDLIYIPIGTGEMQADDDIKVYRCAVGIFNAQDCDVVASIPQWIKYIASTKHHIIANGGLFSGSSGAPFILRNDCVVGIHMESIKHAAIIAESERTHEAWSDAMEVISNTVNSNARVSAALCKALQISRCSGLLQVLCSLGITDNQR